MITVKYNKQIIRPFHSRQKTRANNVAALNHFLFFFLSESTCYLKKIKCIKLFPAILFLFNRCALL